MKKKYPVIYLLEIPVQFFLYVIVIELGAKLEALLFGADGKGYLTMIIFAAATIVLIGATIVSVINFVKGMMKKYKKRKAAREAMK